MFIHFPNDLAKNAAVASALFCFVFLPTGYMCMFVCVIHFFKFWGLGGGFGSLNMKFGPNDILSWHHVFIFPDIKQEDILI